MANPASFSGEIVSGLAYLPCSAAAGEGVLPITKRQRFWTPPDFARPHCVHASAKNFLESKRLFEQEDEGGCQQRRRRRR